VTISIIFGLYLAFFTPDLIYTMFETDIPAWLQFFIIQTVFFIITQRL